MALFTVEKRETVWLCVYFVHLGDSEWHALTYISSIKAQFWPHSVIKLVLWHLKGTVHPKIRNTFPCSAIYQSELFWCELPGFGDIGYRGFCLLSNIKGLNGALNVVLTVPKKYIWKIQHQHLFSEIMTLLHKITHRPCCAQFHVGTTFLSV